MSPATLHTIGGEAFSFRRVKSLRGTGHHWQIIHDESGTDFTQNFRHDTLGNALADMLRMAQTVGDRWRWGLGLPEKEVAI